MVALAAWILGPASWHLVPHAVYFTALVRVIVFAIVPLFDYRRIKALRARGR